jgi:prepilin-type N-terminal cleavage/methylation domain-containing protein
MRTRNRGGWTLIELLIVLIVVVILLSALVALFNEMYRGQGVREGARVFSQALADARTMAAAQRTTHLMKLYNLTDGGVVEIYEDVNGNRALDAADRMVEAGKIYLPPHCIFMTSPKLYPDWIALSPTGGCVYSPGFTGIERSEFDNNYNLARPQVKGDVVLWMKDRPYKMGIDIDRVTGKVRRQEFLFDE